jgi:hypothetical protein
MKGAQQRRTPTEAIRDCADLDGRDISRPYTKNSHGSEYNRVA